MALRLIVTHGGASFEPPVKAGVRVEWERTGVPGKLTFSVIRLEGQSYAEGDVVSLWYDGKPVFRGYIFTIKRSRDEQIDITCYDQLRYLKNKYTYVFENKTATQIIKALCDDYSLAVGTLDSTGYVIPLLAEENKSAFDIALSALQDTLTNTGRMFVLYDDFGRLCVRDAANMVSDSVIMETSAEDYDYTSTIDEETYNNVILYYKEEDNRISLYAASSPSTIKQWGTLRYFEEVRNKTIAANKAKSLLALYNRKKRSLTVKKAFGSVTVRGGTLIPVMLDLGDRTVKNYMLVQKVVHRFDDEHYTMDLTLDGAWDDPETDVVTAAYEAPAPDGGSGSGDSSDSSAGGGMTPSPSAPKKSSGSVSDDAISKLIATAKSQLGVTEYPPGSNKTKYCNEYGVTCAWCVIFLWWCFKHSGNSKNFYGGGKNASSSQLMNYYKSKGKFSKTGPQVGDIVFFNFSNKNGSPKHVGIVIGVNSDGSITTIEGNTGSTNNANGGAVMKRTRYSKNIVGYAHPF